MTSNPSSQSPEQADWLPVESAAISALELPETADEPVNTTEDTTEDIDEVCTGDAPPIPHLLRHPLLAISWIIRNAFGIVSLVALLALVAAVPLVNFLALGYLLEVEGRLGRTGRFRDGFPLLGLAPRLGSIALGTWLWVLPLRLLAGVTADARLIDPEGAAAAILGWVTTLSACFVAVHLCLALARGGGIGCYLRPIKNVRWLLRRLRDGDYWGPAAEYVRQFIAGLRLRHHFSLGLRGFAGALLWLVIPTALLAVADKTEGGPILVTIFGGLCLMLVFAWLPFLQARFAAENRFAAMFELRTIRELFTRAPMTWLLTVIVVYVLALPLYLFKVALPPQDAMWFATTVLIVSIFPAKIMAGWAYHRAAKKEEPAWFGFRWLSRTLMVPLLGLYVFLLFFTQFIGEHGKQVLFENHAFLLPVPF